MRTRIAGILCACAASAAVSTIASGHLVIGVNAAASSGMPAAVFYNQTTQQTTSLWQAAANKGVIALAIDPVGQKIYNSPGARFNVWNYGSVGTAPTQVGGAMIRTGGAVSPQTSNTDDDAWANGGLYAAVNIGSTSYPHGIYQVPLTPDGNNQFPQTPVWTDPTAVPNGTGGFTSGGVYTMDGLAYDSDNGMFYMSNRADNTGSGGSVTAGLYVVDAFGNDSVTKIASLPAASTNISGLGFGGGKLWLSEHVLASNVINVYAYDLTTNTYDANVISIPYTDSGLRSTDVDWVASTSLLPEPASIGAIGLAAAATLRRRTRR